MFPFYSGCRYTRQEIDRMLALTACGIDPASDRYLLERHPASGIRQYLWNMRRKDPARWAEEMKTRYVLPIPPWIEPTEEPEPEPDPEPDPEPEPEIVEAAPTGLIGPSADFIPADLRPRRSLIMAAMQKQWLTKIGKWPAS